jgi:hypothetical protein
LSLDVEIVKKGLNLDKLSPEIKAGLTKGLNAESINLRNYINTRHLTGGTSSDRLGSPSGRLRASGKIIEAKQRGNDIIAGVEYGGTTKGGKPVKYAHIHIGKPGQVTTIKAKSGGALAIPIMAGRTPAGKESAKAKRLKDARKLTFIDREGKPPLLVNTTKKLFEPMYVLKKSVQIRTRVHPEIILNTRQDSIAAAVGREIDAAIRKSKVVLAARGRR